MLLQCSPAGSESTTLCRETQLRGGPDGGHALCSACLSGAWVLVALILAWAASLLLSHPGCNATCCQEALPGQAPSQAVPGQTKPN